MKVEPSPSTDLTDTSPPSASILLLTTSRPTPRPEISVICLAIENDGINRKSIISFCERFSASSGVTRPRSTALSRTLSVLIPPPSSPTSMITLLPSWKALRKIVPFSGLPAARLSSGDSIPWSAELRSKC